MRGKLADLIMTTSPEVYRKYITVNKKGKTVIYVKAFNYIYGIMKALLLFYKNFVGNLTNIGFKINHISCVPQKN